jgi:hypothetical protein
MALQTFVAGLHWVRHFCWQRFNNSCFKSFQYLRVFIPAVSCFKNYITRFTVLLLALQILNLSVQSRPLTDSSDGYLLGHSQLVNPIDHLLEYVVERMMHRKNAFPEDGKHSENAPMQFEKTTAFNLYLSCYTSIKIETPVHHIHPTHRDAYSEGYYYLFASEINPPPPKV